MIGHLGPRVSALLDGQLTPAEAERAWEHVHACHSCRDLVEREGWVKTQLAALSGAGGTPDRLKGELAHGSFLGGPPLPVAALGHHRSRSGVAFLGGTALGAAVAGVLALGVAQGGAPVDRRPPVTSLTRPTATPTSVSSDLRLSTRHARGGIAGVKIVP